MITGTSSLGIFLQSRSQTGKETAIPSCLRESFASYKVNVDKARLSALRKYNRSEFTEFEEFLEVLASSEDPPVMGEEVCNSIANHGIDDDEAIAYARSMIEFWAPESIRAICSQLSIDSSCLYECLFHSTGWKLGRLFVELFDEDEDDDEENIEDYVSIFDIEVLLGIELTLDPEELAFDLGCEAGVDVGENALAQIKDLVSAIHQGWGLA